LTLTWPESSFNFASAKGGHPVGDPVSEFAMSHIEDNSERPAMPAGAKSQRPIRGREWSSLLDRGFFAFPVILEDVLDGRIECTGQAESQWQRRRVPAGLDGDDRLARDAYPVGELLLGHLTMLEPEPANLIRDLQISHVRLPDRIG
jgi:hypothetical protein